MKRLAVIIAVLLAGCASAPQTPNLLADVNLWTQDSASLHAAAMGSNVTWQMGTPPAEHYGAYTTWWCVFDTCTFSVVVRPGYWTRDIVRHEAGHIWCRTWLNDASEQCADQASGVQP